MYVFILFIFFFFFYGFTLQNLIIYIFYFKRYMYLIFFQYFNFIFIFLWFHATKYFSNHHVPVSMYKNEIFFLKNILLKKLHKNNANMLDFNFSCTKVV